MAKVIDPVVATYYENTVKVAYQSGATLRPYVRVRTSISGATAEFPRIGRGMARPHVPASPRVPMGAQYAKAVATLSGWDATEYADQLDAGDIVFNEVPVLSQTVGNGLGRREDQLIIDALVAAFSAATIPAGGVGMTETKLRQIVRLFDERAVPRDDRYLVVSAAVYDQMRAIPTITSRDFGATEVWRTGQLPVVLGMNVILIDNARPEGGLPLSGTTRQCFAFDRNAVGLATSKEPAVEIDWIPHLAAWQVSGRIKAGACVIDPEGVIRIDCVE